VREFCGGNSATMPVYRRQCFSLYDSAEVSRLRTGAIQLSESAIDTVLESTVEVWSALTSERRVEVLRHWKRGGLAMNLSE
jgi:hypothetical protein